MSVNDLKKHTVKVGSGSGCVFQPMDDAHTYILTAKHLFQNINDETQELDFFDDGIQVPLTFLKFNGNDWDVNTEMFNVQFEENFFPHQNADAAILKIPFCEGFENIHIRKKRLKNDYYLCGFPGRLSHQDTIGNSVATFAVERFKQSGDYFDVAELSNNNITRDEIKGCSGGGIMASDGASNIFISGIQSRMATNVNFPLGEIGFVDVKYFEEIIESYHAEGKLVELLPVFLKSFVSLIGETFKMGAAPIHNEEAVLSELLSTKAELIRQSDLTPLSLKSFLGDERLLFKDQDSVELRRKKIWTFWLELLVILNIAKNKVHNSTDLKDLSSKVRFFYSDTENDFLSQHLQDLWKIDYTDLEDDGLVVFTSNQKYLSQNTQGILDLCEVVTDIASARRAFAKEQNQLLGDNEIDITEAKAFPFDRFKYTSISTFKEYAALDLDEEFINMKPEECYPLLKDLYEELLP